MQEEKEKEKVRVLIADDEEDVRRVIAEMLGHGYTILEAGDGEEALQMARVYKPQLIVMDIFMPKMDGYNACFELKNDEMTRNIPVVVLSGKAGLLGEKLCQAIGADAYLDKPFSLLNLLMVTIPLIKGSRKADAVL